ncbi:MAG: DUF4280 domain-containing protein [Clostridia bacterium]|nr:DUF4280 domain-containing protein [Clostridia bacterium]
MGILVCGGAQCLCSFGTAPSNLVVTPENKTLTSQPIATIMDNKPNVNILPFGMCTSMANPAVASATAAAMGVLTPQPCTPVIGSPWAPGSSTVLISNKPALTMSSQLFCSYAGVIQITNPGQQTIQVP